MRLVLGVGLGITRRGAGGLVEVPLVVLLKLNTPPKRDSPLPVQKDVKSLLNTIEGYDFNRQL